MMDYWNSGYRKLKEQIFALLPDKPSYQYSNIPKFQQGFEQERATFPEISLKKRLSTVSIQLESTS